MPPLRQFAGKSAKLANGLDWGRRYGGRMTSPDVVVPRPGAQLPGPFEIQVQVRSEHTNGVLAVIGETLAPRILVPTHVHHNDVWVRVESGEIGVLVGDEVQSARAGEWALKPRDIEHAMWNPADEPARIIEVLTPGGSERWFEELAVLADEDDAGCADACRRHGIEFHLDSAWIPRLKERYGLT